MQIISNASESVLSILKKFRKAGADNRLFKYCVQSTVEDGVLLFNLLTRELLLLSKEEFSRFTELDYLKERWFVVPEDTNDKEFADFVKWVFSVKQKQSKNIVGYTIFPTTDCNARCFYCFELGRSRIPMTEDTAKKVAQYISDHCGGERVSISWFGGEPLFNLSAIDTICQGLRDRNVEFRSKMISNGYLFDDEIVRKAVDSWNLKRVQISLDGTEKIYNKVKAYIYRGSNAYGIVMNNIGRLLEAGIFVTIRLNMDLYNAEDLLQLVDDLAERFAGRAGLQIYAHHLFKGDEPMAELHTAEEWAKREDAMSRLEERIAKYGLLAKNGFSKQLKMNFCMADSDKSVTILPDGNIGVCEHFSESEFIGHIDHEGFDTAMVESWKERMPEISECADCFYYPECIRLKKCANGSICFPLHVQEKLRKTLRSMVSEYQRWQAKTAPEEMEEDNDC